MERPKTMPKTFDFAEAEARIYAWWEENGWFKPEAAAPDAEPYVISMPPPNVTGKLHIGHALFSAMEDLMIRYQRMRGKAALWLPGTDHAGIATQLQVERMLRDEGTSRQEIGREAFLARTWEWKAKYGGTIIRQLRRLGASCDWDRERFTLDEGLSEAVQEVFIRLYEQGLIYRGPRLVNWSPGLQTAVSDLEVERGEEEDGSLYLFYYPVEGGEHIPVATTRPETILADTAVAVHPEDPRYMHFIGRRALVPILNRPIPIIADPYVDREFGTGALKVTPGHDFNDYELARRHNLEMISVLNRDATINSAGGPYAGMDRFACRAKLWADMQAAGMTIEVRPHRMVVPRSQRGGEVIEPMLSTQWFLRIEPLAQRALQAVRDGEITIVPERFERVYNHWLENIEDWCISRQLWWGHRIPAWVHDDGRVHVGHTAPEGDGWTAEEDVLDTWFSSGLWPFSTLGWPHDTPDMRRYYPTSMMETGYDILFFWVARMIMLGLWFTDRAPFQTVYLHGLVRDKFGRKVSKTLGNVMDPLDLIDRFGADPLRMTLVTGSTPGNDINLDEARIERNWRFVNKIWQMTNFVSQNLGDEIPAPPPAAETLDLPSRWILSRLHRLVSTVQRLFDAHQYGEAGRQIDDFIWGEFADWYIEFSKGPLYQGNDADKAATRSVLYAVLETSLRLLHPFMPFMTEEAWQYLPHQGAALIMARWPEADPARIDDVAERDMQQIIELTRSVRNVREEYRVEPSRRITALAGGSTDSLARLQRYASLFARLCNIAELSLLQGEPGQSAAVTVGDVTLYLPLADFVDTAAECERLRKELTRLEEQIGRSQNMLGNQQFISRARPDVVEREKAKLADLQASAVTVSERIAGLCS
jgi:valyl-tRNA synthetase